MKTALLNLVVNHFELLVISFFIFLFLVIFICVFRRPLTGFIQRTNSISVPGIKATTNPESQSTAGTKESAQRAAERLIKNIENTYVLQNVEKSIKDALEKEELDTQGYTIEVLVKHLASTQILLEFEKIYGVIFGSQIALLKRMNETRGLGMTKQDIRPYFEKAKPAYPEIRNDDYLERYIGYLLEKNLILCSGEKYYLEKFGFEYLRWMVRDGKWENKVF